MTLPGKSFEHADGIGRILGLAEQATANDYCGIRTKDGLIPGGGYGHGFLLGQPKDILLRLFAR